MSDYFDALKRAIDAVDVLDCWRELMGDAPTRPGVYKSPFREDRHPSFSVFRSREGGLLCMDKARDDKAYGSWEFVKRARPHWEKEDLHAWFFERSGVRRPERRELTPAEKREWRKERERETAEARRRLYRERERQVRGSAAAVADECWGAEDKAAWEEGLRYAEAEPGRVSDLAGRRGWPLEWMDALVTGGRAGWPLDRKGKRNVAFVVERPVVRGGVLYLSEIGYHQRWFRPESGRKMWSYRPKGITAWPFVLGEQARPALVAVTEGQWDACTLWGALGGFDDTGNTPAEALRLCVVGLRGTHSIEPFLSVFGPWIRHHECRVWLLPDADEAASSWHYWVKPTWNEKTKPRPISFVERVGALAGSDRVGMTRLKVGRAGKDFNDYWIARRPSAEAIISYLRTKKLVA